MELHVQLISQTPNSSLSVLTIEGKFSGFILEDGYREVKVKAETRIPPGTYNIVRRRVGKIYAGYHTKYGHTFVPQLADVPNFSDILIHIGNDVTDTAGCLLVGNQANFDRQNNLFKVLYSTEAYLYLYGRLFQAFQSGEKVTITINREVPPFAVAQNPTV